ncbi:MAG TPA: hypothetical protein GXZ39_04760 [Bacteroidales bacterium]|nr:hypothetical protein [Bacteroidales bacterium]
MPRFNNRFIDAETYAFFKKIRMPYTGFVKGKGYAYTHANTVFPAHQCAVTPPTMVPYNQAHCQTVLFQYMNTSPDAIARSYNLSKEDLVRTVVRRRPGGGLTVNWGNGSFKQFEVGTVMNARIHETNGRLAFEIVFKPLDGKTEKLTGFVSDMPRVFGKHSSDMPLDIPGEHNFSTSDVAASLFDEKLPADKAAVKTRTPYTQSFGYIFTDPSGTAAPDASPFRARHTAEFPDALSWFALFGSYGRPWANSRGTNFWGNFGKSIEKLSEVGESVKPEEVYGPGAIGAKGDSVQLKLPGRKAPVGFTHKIRHPTSGEYHKIDHFESDSLEIEVKHRWTGYRDSVLVWRYAEGPDSLVRITPTGKDLYLRWPPNSFYLKGPLEDK